MGKFQKPQPGLFDRAEPRIELTPALKIQLAKLTDVLFAEIAAALANREVGDDQDHR